MNERRLAFLKLFSEPKINHNPFKLIDERSKLYSSAGDDKVNQTITDLVRGPLASGIKQMLEQVLSSLLYIYKIGD